MENITLGQIVAAIGIITTIVGVISKIFKVIAKADDDRKELLNCIKSINKRIDTLDEGQCKNYMSRFLKDIEQNRPVDSIETERFWEIYDHYVKPANEGGLGLNSYFHNKVEKLQKEGKL